MTRTNRILALAGALAGLAGAAGAQGPPRPAARSTPYKREVPRRLLAQTKISEDSARAVAMARIPGAEAQALELENEHGHLIWSWELRLEGKTGIEEVNVDALDGSIVGVEHEEPSARRRDTTRGVASAQQLVNRTVAAHPELAGLELALETGGVCRTVAATAPEDIGERCDKDEWGPIRTGTPDVEAPSAADPVYDITQALHDSAGRLIGAVGMDLKPMAGQDRAAVVARARAILREMEAAIPSKARLLSPDAR